MRRFATEETYEQEMKERYLPALRACRREGTFMGAGGAALFYVRYDAAISHGTVLILHGLNESTEKYCELIAYLLEEGLSVLIYDQRGHGKSARSVRRGLTHVDRFDDYVEDALACIAQPLSACPPPYYLFGHSMGGAVAALLLERGEHPFVKAVLSSPMIQSFRYPHIPPALVRTFCRTVSACGGGRKGVFVAKEADLKEDFEHSCALSPARFAAYAAIRRAEPAYRSGIVTYRWVAEAMGVTKRLLKKGGPERIRIPVRLYSAERDHLVETPPQEAFAARAPQGEFIRIVGSKHEIYAASDDILHPYLESVLDFFTSP